MGVVEIDVEGQKSEVFFSFPCSSVGMHTIVVPTLEHGNQASACLRAAHRHACHSREGGNPGNSRKI